MRDISRFQMNVAKARKQLKESKESTLEEVYQKFRVSKQEPFRIASSLYCYFSEEKLGDNEQAELEHYMRFHVRNIVEALIEEDAPEKILRLQEKGWFGLTELDNFIGIARERKKMQSLLWLMGLKNKVYGYQEQEWLL